MVRYVSDTRRMSGSRPTPPARSACSGCRRRRSRSPAITTRSSASTGSSPVDYEYEVTLDGERAWPEAGSEFPPSVISTLEPGGKTDLVFASCRVALPHEEPYILRKDEDESGREVDSLYVLGCQMLEDDRSDFPEAILMLGDQVYADEVSPRVQRVHRGAPRRSQRGRGARSTRSRTSRSTPASTGRPGASR